MPYTTKGKCVYKKDTGKKVGCTDGPVSKYLGALHANTNENMNENESRKNVKVQQIGNLLVMDFDSNRGDFTTAVRTSHKYTPEEIKAIIEFFSNQSSLGHDEFIELFRRKGKSESHLIERNRDQSMQLAAHVPKNIKEAVTPTSSMGDDNVELVESINSILDYIRKYPSKEKFVIDMLQRRLTISKTKPPHG